MRRGKGTRRGAVVGNRVVRERWEGDSRRRKGRGGFETSPCVHSQLIQKYLSGVR